jgi:hypothetical protein
MTSKKDTTKKPVMDVEREIEKIQQRNARVELDKRWENSGVRKLTICLLTFAVVLIYNQVISQQVNVILSSLVPVIGFFLSTLSLGYVRNIWERDKDVNNG